MLKNLCALVLLGLAVSPFTAPFQTCYEASQAIVAPLTNEDDPGSLVGPLLTQAGRLTVALPTGLSISHFVPVAFVVRFIPRANHTRLPWIRLTVLRV